MKPFWGDPNETKVCAKCRVTKSLFEFAKANGNYARSECRECGKKQSKIRDELKKQHAKPGEDYVCPVCNRTYDDIKYLGKKINAWCLDHDHTTGKFRGWLCHDCNKAIGFFKDDAARMKSAIKYLEENA